jgi:glucose/arabinose dehydrogenase
MVSSRKRCRPLACLALLAGLPALSVPAEAGSSLRLLGTARGDGDRVLVPIDGPPKRADGPTDFTIELWMRGRASENAAAPVTCGGDFSWVDGSILLDADLDFGDRELGLSLAGGRLAFGTSGYGTGDRTICGATDVLDDRWHHVALQRRHADGWLWLFVDGVLEAEADGPDGDAPHSDVGVRGGGPGESRSPFLVIGAGKHDADSAHPSFSGWVDELRVSSVLRYTSTFTRPAQAFTTDAHTAALRHFDAGAGGAGADSAGGEAVSTESPPFDRSISLAAVATGFENPVAMAHAGDGSGRLFVVEQPGRIRIFDGTRVRAAPFLDLRGLVACCGERGLLGLAFHPQYPTNGAFYVYYTNLNGDIVIARYRVSSDPNVADPASASVLLTIPHPGQSNHNGGALAFGPDGRLYVGVGDGGGGGDPDDNGQDRSVLLGKVLRLAVDGGAGYTVPPDNPFVSTPGARGEIWAYGLRNPWRITFDRLTGDLFIGDVGQSRREEIDFEPRGSSGRNYGWVRMEGSLCYRPSAGCYDATLTLPVLEYDHSLGCSVTGGYRYRGRAAPGFDGVYFFGDYCTGRVFGGVEDGAGGWSSTLLVDTPYNISSFGEDGNGELYLLALGSPGTLYRLVAGAQPPFGFLDTPAAGATGVSGAIPVTGWALDDVGVQAVEVWRDAVAGEGSGPIFVGNATFVAGARPDVAGAYPAYPNADRAGWGYMLLTNLLPGAGNGPYTLHAWAIDGDGNRTRLGSSTIGCSNATATKPFGTIDTPGQGATVSGTAYVVYGWALTPQPALVPTDGSTIEVFVDGVPRGQAGYNQFRADIARLFPGYGNANGAVGYFYLDTTTLANGIHTIAWSVTDNLGRADGIGSRYFWVQN